MEQPLTADQKKEKLAVLFDSVAERYDTNRFFKMAAQHLVQAANLEPEGMLLDLSTGTGHVALAAAQHYPRLKVIGLDLSTAMLAQARIKAQALGLQNIAFEQADAESLRYPDKSFDVITCAYGLFFYPQLSETFQLIFNKLKQGGRFIFTTFTKEAFSPYSDWFFALLKEYGINPPELSRTSLNEKEQIEALCRSVRARRVTIYREEIRYDIRADEWWELLTSAGYKGLLDEIKAKDRKEFKERLLTRISASEHQPLVLIADTWVGTVWK